MRASLPRAIVLGLVLLLASGAAPQHAGAQELDVLEVDDYLAPRDLAAAADAAGKDRRLFISWVLLGAIGSYQYRDVFSDEPAVLAHSVNALHFGRTQANLKLTGFAGGSGDRAPHFRARGQLARYLTGRREDDGFRAQLSWTVDDAHGRSLRHELAADLNFLMNIRGLHYGFIGGVVYARNLTDDHDHLGIAARLPIIRWGNGSAVRVGGGLAQRSIRIDDLLRGPDLAKTELSVEWILPRGETRLHAGYTPAFDRGQHEWNHEFSLLLNAPIFASLF